MNIFHVHSQSFSSRRLVEYFFKRPLSLMACAIASFVPSVVSAQQSNVTTDSHGNVSATSILNNTTSNSRIGGYEYDGRLHPTPGANSRFSSEGAVYGNSGNIVGVDRSSTSRFSQSSTFQPKQQFDLLAFRNQLYKAREEALANYRASQAKLDNDPRLVTATAPKSFPYSNRSQSVYGRRPEERNSPDKQAPSETALQQQAIPNAPENTLPFNKAQGIWMRGRAPQTGAVVPQGVPSAAGLLDYTQGNGRALAGQWDNQAESVLGGSMNLGGPSTGAWSFPPIKTSAEIRQAFIETLEGQLLQSPDVSPLSPIQVEYQNGVATVRGVVPTPSARVAAGKILLANPQIQRVNNLLTFVRNDDPIGVGAPQAATPTTSNGVVQNNPNQK